jgi:hypothetical protein
MIKALGSWNLKNQKTAAVSYASILQVGEYSWWWWSFEVSTFLTQGRNFVWVLCYKYVPAEWYYRLSVKLLLPATAFYAREMKHRIVSAVLLHTTHALGSTPAHKQMGRQTQTLKWTSCRHTLFRSAKVVDSSWCFRPYFLTFLPCMCAATTQTCKAIAPIPCSHSGQKPYCSVAL